MKELCESLCPPVASLCSDNNHNVGDYSTAHHEAAALVLTGEQAVELAVPECLCSAFIRVEHVKQPRPPLPARLSSHEGTQ